MIVSTRVRSALLLLSCANLLCACSALASGATVELDGKRFDVEIAADPESQTRGLMFRDSMAPDHGMLFTFDETQVRTFWMKNTRIPLDILYFDDQYKLVSMQQRVPPCTLGDRCPVYPSTGPARYVLELNAGTAEKLGTKPGDTLKVTR